MMLVLALMCGALLQIYFFLLNDDVTQSSFQKYVRSYSTVMY